MMKELIENYLPYFLIAVLVPVAMGAISSGSPLLASDESSTAARVDVLPGEGCNYGNRVINGRTALFPFWALGKPDGRGAFILLNGWISIQLEKTVPAANAISIWAADRGWGSANVRIYISADGKKWKQVEHQRVTVADYTRYDFSGDYGTVKYIRVNHSGRWSYLLLDAVCAKGGDSSEQPKNPNKR
jgi:hypothetical protein